MMPGLRIAGVEGRTWFWPGLAVWKAMLVVVLTVTHRELGEGVNVSRHGENLRSGRIGSSRGSLIPYG
jgi:hypothetical protein